MAEVRTIEASGAGGAQPPVPEDSSSVRTGVARVGGWWAVVFLLPALVILGAMVVYPIVYTVRRSLYDAAGSSFVGLRNFGAMFTDPATFTAVKNNAIWVVAAPTLVCALGLIFAVLTERVRWGTAFKLLIFMPMAISFVAAGVIFRLVY